MFFFGSPRDAADMYYADVIAAEKEKGHVPEMPRNAADEMTEAELRTALTWVAYSWRRGDEDGIAQEVLDQIEKDYVEVICFLAVASPKYAQWASSPASRHIHPGNRKKQKLYRQLIITACVEAGEDTYFKEEDGKLIIEKTSSAD